MKCAYAEFSALDDPMQVNEEAFREILSRKAPGLYKKADTSGHVEDGARTLRGQFELAYKKQHGDAAVVVGSGGGADPPAPQQPPLSEHKEIQANVMQGLVKMLMAEYQTRGIVVKLRHTECLALIDTSAAKCSFPEATVDKCGMRAIVDETYKTDAVHGRVHHVPVSVAVTEGEKADQGAVVIFETAFEVVPAFPEHLSEYDCRLGCDFLVRYKAALDFGGSSIKLETPSGEFVNISFVWNKEKEDKELAEARFAAASMANAPAR